MQRGGSSKDTWVTVRDARRGNHAALRSAIRTWTCAARATTCPARLADNFFWLGRYSERADATARLLRSTLRRFNPERTGSAMPLLGPLLQTLEKQGQLPGLLEKTELRQNPEAFEAELLAAIFDPARSGSLRHVVDHLQRLAMFVRDRTSNDMWRVLSQLNERLAMPATSLVLLAGDATGGAERDAARPGGVSRPGAREHDPRAGVAVSRHGLAPGTRDLSLHAAGCHAAVARGGQPQRARSRAGSGGQLHHLTARVTPCCRTCRRCSTSCCSTTKTRARCCFQFNQLVQHFERLPREREARAPVPASNPAECLARLKQTDARELAGRRTSWTTARSAPIIAEILRDLPKLSDAIAADYFAHSAISRTGRGTRTMNYNIIHRTLYEYAAPVTVSHHVARLEPRATTTQERENFSLKIFPEPALRKSRTDYFGNRLCFFSIQEVHSRLEIITAQPRDRARGKVAARTNPSPRVGGGGADCSAIRFRRKSSSRTNSSLTRRRCARRLSWPITPRRVFPTDTPLLAGARDLTRRIFEDFKYDPKATTVATPLEEVWEKRRGVCQDFAHLGIACLRSLGLPARYVSGYLRTRPPEGREHNSWARTLRTRGLRFFVRARAGWISTRPTICSRRRNTSPWRTAGISATSARWRASSPAAANMSSRWRWT